MPYYSDWYETLILPPLTPAAEAFPTVWTILYAMLAVSFLLYLTAPYDKSKKSGYIWFLAQLALNLAWSPVFFGMQSPIGSLCILVALVVCLLATLRRFYAVSTLSVLFLLPYTLWCLFALYLNIGIVALN